MSERLLATELLLDAFGRVHDELPGLVAGLDADDLLWRPHPGGNSIAWLVWHLSRVQDDHVADIGEVDQVWTTGGWPGTWGLPYPDQATGYGQSSHDVGAFVLDDPVHLTRYHEAVHTLTESVLEALSAADYQRVIDTSWDPPVTAAVRLVSVVNDVTQHFGQAAYVRGLLDRRT